MNPHAAPPRKVSGSQGSPRGGYLGQVAGTDGHGEKDRVYGSHNLEEHGYIIEDVSEKPEGVTRG